MTMNRASRKYPIPRSGAHKPCNCPRQRGLCRRAHVRDLETQGPPRRSGGVGPEGNHMRPCKREAKGPRKEKGKVTTSAERHLKMRSVEGGGRGLTVCAASTGWKSQGNGFSPGSLRRRRTSAQ